MQNGASMKSIIKVNNLVSDIYIFQIKNNNPAVMVDSGWYCGASYLFSLGRETWNFQYKKGTPV